MPAAKSKAPAAAEPAAKSKPAARSKASASAEPAAVVEAPAPAKPAAKARPAAAAEPAKPASRPSIRFIPPADLQRRITALLATVEKADDPCEHADALASLCVEMTEAGLNYYFIKPLEDAKMGFVTRQTANFGVSGVLRLMSPVIRSIVGGAKEDELRAICHHIQHLMS